MIKMPLLISKTFINISLYLSILTLVSNVLINWLLVSYDFSEKLVGRVYWIEIKAFQVFWGCQVKFMTTIELLSYRVYYLIQN